MIEELLYNLCSNAIRYNKANGLVDIMVEKNKEGVLLQVKDTGIGISNEHQEHVFERFYRTNKERNIKGHGLGLSIAKKKCDMLGCKLTVESNEDDGTTFTIVLKARKK
jgi:two-component system phosphate regulon sensor histidine kinase PhoR